jgi:hypothetical protein
MSDKLFSLGWACFSVIFTFFGVLMSIGSYRSTRLLEKLLGGLGRSPGALDNQRMSFGWEWRLAGLAITALGIYFILLAIH